MKILRTKILGLTLALGGLVLCGTGLWLLLSPAQYRATVSIKVNNEEEGGDNNMIGERALSPGYDPYFVPTAFEVIQSQFVLSNVISVLNLNGEWGKKHGDGSPLKTLETIKLLRCRMNFESYRDTKTIKINYSSEDPNEAATIANAIAKAYSDYRLVRWQQMTQTGIRTLEELYKEEENQIRVNQRSVDLLREKFKIDKEDEAESNLVPGFAKTITPTELEQLRKKFNEQRPFWDEKRKLRSLEEFHKALATKIEAEKSFFQIPKNPVVEFVDAAKPPEFPVGPNRWLGATMFAIGLLPTVGGILLLKSSCRSMLLL